MIIPISILLFYVFNTCALHQVYYGSITDETYSFHHSLGEKESLNKKDTYLGNNRPLSCAEIAKLNIVRPLGAGKKKIAYEVILPYGGHGVAKRCNHYTCYKDGLLQEEAHLLKGLYQHYGNEALHFYGDCSAPYSNDDIPVRNVTGRGTAAIATEYIQNHSSSFEVGYTSIVELGRPLLSSWDLLDRKCFAKYFKPKDIEDLINIARRYAFYTNKPILLGRFHFEKDGPKLRTTDNIFPQQYMTRVGGHDEGSINHIDLDMTVLGREHYGGDNKYCTPKNVLKLNCKIISKLTNIRDLDCSYPSTDVNRSNKTKKKSPTDYTQNVQPR